MEVIKQEIFSQTEALDKTRELLMAHRDELRQALQQPCSSLIFLGCGSGYMLSCSGAAAFSLHTDQKAVALAGGEVLLEPKRYQHIFADSLVIVTSRSGETSEIVLTLQAMREQADFRTLGILASRDCTLEALLELSLTIPWAFDQSVCQTRTISNFYYSLMMLYAFYREDEPLIDSFSQFFRMQPQYLTGLHGDCRRIAAGGWDNVTLLADGEVCGIASEGGLAFTEISMIPGEHFHLLDYRHGPIVVAAPNKLVIALLNPTEELQQAKMISDIRKNGAFVITLGLKDQDFWGSDFHVSLDAVSHFPVWGLALINLCQVLAFCKALELGHDPDMPEGLNPYIKL